MGAPKGNKSSTLEHRALSNALRRSLARKALKGTNAASRIADRLVESALGGEPWAVGMVFDRLEGKPHQAVSIGGDEDSAPISLRISAPK